VPNIPAGPSMYRGLLQSIQKSRLLQSQLWSEPIRTPPWLPAPSRLCFWRRHAHIYTRFLNSLAVYTPKRCAAVPRSGRSTCPCPLLPSSLTPAQNAHASPALTYSNYLKNVKMCYLTVSARVTPCQVADHSSGVLCYSSSCSRVQSCSQQ
jgi:hypothetical protein